MNRIQQYSLIMALTTATLCAWSADEPPPPPTTNNVANPAGDAAPPATPATPPKIIHSPVDLFILHRPK